MKTKVVVGSLLATMLTFEVMAQRAENDDMYFNSKDREKLRSEKVEVAVGGKSANDKIDSDYNTFRKKHFDKDEAETEVVKEATNPTDSYSARSINPEYIARSNGEQATEEENYYMEGYVPPNVYDSYSASNYDNTGNYNNYNNSYYGNYGYGGYNGMSSMYSPYYNCNPWMSPYNPYASGLTLSMAYMWGNPWNSGWSYGMSYGWGNSYYNPYSYYPSYYSPYYGGGYGYPSYYGVVDASRPNYGKRPSRHSAIVSPTPRSSERVSANTTTSGSTGRTRQIVDEYYVKPYKRTTSSDSFMNSSTDGSGDRYSRPTTSDYPATRTRDSYSSPSKDSRSSYSTPTRTSSPQISTPSRSSGSSSGGSSGGSSPAPRKRN
jgi:hypothetical protein